MNKTNIIYLKFIYIFLIIASVLLTYSNKTYADTKSQNINNNISIYSKAAILIDSKTGQILYSHNSSETLFPASTTKLMTAILTLENCNLTDTVTIQAEYLYGIPKGYTTAALQPGETLTVEQLLHVLLIPSANDAGNVLACHIAGSVDNFSIMMNSKAKELGCLNTNFVNPSGVHDDNHYSTAYDMSLIGKYAHSFEKIKEITNTKNYSLPDLPDGSKRIFKTTNTLITPSNEYYYEYATGLKTGYTDKAKSCIVATAKKDNIELICVILGGDKTANWKSQRELDCHTLFNYGFENYEYYKVCGKNESLNKSNIINLPSDLQNCDIIYSEDLSLLVNKHNYNNTTSDISWNISQLPIYKNTTIGTITYNIDGKHYVINLLANSDILPIKSTNSISQFFYILIGIFVIILLITIFNKQKNKFHKKKKSSKEPKYFRHSFY